MWVRANGDEELISALFCSFLLVLLSALDIRRPRFNFKQTPKHWLLSPIYDTYDLDTTSTCKLRVMAEKKEAQRSLGCGPKR